MDEKELKARIKGIQNLDKEKFLLDLRKTGSVSEALKHTSLSDLDIRNWYETDTLFRESFLMYERDVDLEAEALLRKRMIEGEVKIKQVPGQKATKEIIKSVSSVKTYLDYRNTIKNGQDESKEHNITINFVDKKEK